jgi:hypothetical protein
MGKKKFKQSRSNKKLKTIMSDLTSPKAANPYKYST